MRKALARILVRFAHRIEGITFFPTVSNPSEGRFAIGFQTDWAEFGKQFHWRLSWTYSPSHAMFLGPNNTIISITREIRDAIELVKRNAKQE